MVFLLLLFIVLVLFFQLSARDKSLWITEWWASHTAVCVCVQVSVWGSKRAPFLVTLHLEAPSLQYQPGLDSTQHPLQTGFPSNGITTKEERSGRPSTHSKVSRNDGLAGGGGGTTALSLFSGPTKASMRFCRDAKCRYLPLSLMCMAGGGEKRGKAVDSFLIASGQPEVSTASRTLQFLCLLQTIRSDCLPG